MLEPWQPHLKQAYLIAHGGDVPDLFSQGGRLSDGNLNFLKHAHYREESHIIGVDGGANRLKKIHVEPDAVIGDLDSVEYEFKNQIHLPDQNQSDLEKAIVYLLARGVNNFIIYGALGGKRQDHHLANLDLLTKYAPQCRIMMVAFDGSTIEGLSPENTAPDGLDLPVRRHSKIGVLPFGDSASVTLRGTQYELNQAEVRAGSHGVGNRAESDMLHIQVHTGRVRLICNNRPEVK